MYKREMGGSSNHNLGVSKKSMEKTTPSSSQLARDRAKPSEKPTSEKLGSDRGMKPSDRAITNDSPRLEYGKMLDVMQMIMVEKQDLTNRLEQANQRNASLQQENDKLQNTIQDFTRQANQEKEELATQLKQVLQKNEELANQLKQARSGGTSSLLQKGEASSQSDKPGKSNIRKWMKDELAKKKEERNK